MWFWVHQTSPNFLRQTSHDGAPMLPVSPGTSLNGDGQARSNCRFLTLIMLKHSLVSPDLTSLLVVWWPFLQSPPSPMQEGLDMVRKEKGRRENKGEDEEAEENRNKKGKEEKLGRHQTGEGGN